MIRGILDIEKQFVNLRSMTAIGVKREECDYDDQKLEHNSKHTRLSKFCDLLKMRYYNKNY